VALQTCETQNENATRRDFVQSAAYQQVKKCVSVRKEGGGGGEYRRVAYYDFVQLLTSRCNKIRTSFKH